MVRYGIADDFTVVHVQYWRQVAFVHADVYLGHIRCPLLVWAGRSEVSVEYVRGYFTDVALVGSVLATSADILQVFFLHDAIHGLVIDHEAFVPQLILDTSVAVTALVFRMYGFDSLALVGVAVVLLLDVVVVCRAG